MNIYLLSRKWDWNLMSAIGTGSKVSSRRDLEVGAFHAFRRLKSTVNKVLSLRDFKDRSICSFRRLKPTVNKVPSLRDFEEHVAALVRSSVDKVSSLRDFGGRLSSLLFDLSLMNVRKSRREVALLSYGYEVHQKSRRDDTLLTVDFNLRTQRTLYSQISPAGTTLWNDDSVTFAKENILEEYNYQ